MTPDDQEQSGGAEGEVILSTLPGANPDVIDVPESDPNNETPTQKAARMQQQQRGGIVPADEDG